MRLSNGDIPKYSYSEWKGSLPSSTQINWSCKQWYDSTIVRPYRRGWATLCDDQAQERGWTNWWNKEISPEVIKIKINTFFFPLRSCSSRKASWFYKGLLLLESLKEPISFQGRGFNCSLWKRGFPHSLWKVLLHHLLDLRKESLLLKDCIRRFNRSIQKKSKELPLAGFETGPPEWQAEMISITPCHSRKK